MMLIFLTAAIVPVLVFAFFVFEAGSIERYLPLCPFVALAFGSVLGNTQTNAVSKVLLCVTLAVMTVVNIKAMSRGSLEVRKAKAETRIHDLIPLLKPNDIVMAVNEQDNLAEFRLDYPLDPINLDHTWQTYDVLEINTARLATWREDFATLTLAICEDRFEISSVMPVPSSS